MKHQKDIESLFRLYLDDQLDRENAELLLSYLDNDEYSNLIRQIISQHLENREIVATTMAEKNAVDEVHRRLEAYLDEEEGVQVKKGSGFRRIGTWLYDKVAVIVLLLASAAVALLFQEDIRSWIDPVHMVEVRTQKGERRAVELPDGTKVHLNNLSSLSYPEKFAKDKREVILDGEAWFEVAKEPSKPFIVASAELRTQVLGTSFIVKAYPGDEDIAVSVFEGKVRVGSIKDGQTSSGQIVLVANEQVLFSRKDDRLTKTENVDMRDKGLWNRGILRLRNLSFMEAIRVLERMYDVEIEYGEGMGNCPVYADFSEEEKVEDILEALAISLNGKYELVENGTWKITGLPCNGK